jgi:putative phosphoribosyl transferase
VHAGNMLAEKSTNPSLNSLDRKQATVLGIPRGGVIIADIVARKLSADFGVVIRRKFESP